MDKTTHCIFLEIDKRLRKMLVIDQEKIYELFMHQYTKIILTILYYWYASTNACNE